MAGAKLVVMYPIPKNVDAFERAYSAEHLPMAAPVFKAAGATKVVLSKITGSAAGTAPIHRIAEIHFRSLADLQACASSKAGKEVVDHAHSISNGGPPTILTAEEDVVSFQA